MADVTTRLISLLKADTTIAQTVGPRIHQGYVPEGTPAPFIFVTRQDVNYERCLGETAGTAPFSHSFAIECYGLDLDDSQDLADRVRAYDGYTGAFGDSTVQGIFIDNQSDDYEPTYGDHVATLSAEVFPS